LFERSCRSDLDDVSIIVEKLIKLRVGFLGRSYL